MARMTLKNGFTVEKENGIWVLYKPSREVVATFSDADEACKVAYQVCNWRGDIESDFSTENEADKWIKEHLYTEFHIRGKHFDSESGKWIVTWHYEDDEIDYDDMHPERPIEL